MAIEFNEWLKQHGLTEQTTTVYGDSFYTNKDKQFGVIRKKGENGVHSFYLDDITGFKTYDNDSVLIEWERGLSWHIMKRPTDGTATDIHIDIALATGDIVRLQIFVGNISRDSAEHINLCNYASQVSKAVMIAAE